LGKEVIGVYRQSAGCPILCSVTFAEMRQRERT
jgi:hypothetical protein